MYVFLPVLIYIGLFIFSIGNAVATGSIILFIAVLLILVVFSIYTAISCAKSKDILKKIGMCLFSPALWKARIKYGKNYINESDDPKVKAYLKLCDFIKAEKEAYIKEQEKMYEREEKGRENPEYVKVVNTQEFPKSNSFFFIRLLGLILCVAIIVGGLLFYHKKTSIDYQGDFAYNYLTYDDCLGFTDFITYKTEYRYGDADGFAITHLDLGIFIADVDDQDLYALYMMANRFHWAGDYSEWVSILLKSDLEIRDFGKLGKFYVIDYDTFEKYTEEYSYSHYGN